MTAHKMNEKNTTGQIKQLWIKKIMDIQYTEPETT
jgi:hypothetical protein